MNFKLENLNHATDSICSNYKSWLLILLGICFINPTNISSSIFTFVVMLVFAHASHFMSHTKYGYPGNLVHLYHHDNNNWFSHFIQIVLELVVFLFISVIKYINERFFETGMFYTHFIKFIDPWISLFVYLFYTTVHNINYSCFHVNHVHELHHQYKLVNIGPDICDILFGTKHEVESGVENTDHYIPNIIFITICVFLMKYYWKNEVNKEAYIVIFGVMFCICVILLLETNCVLYIQKQVNATTDPYNVPTKSCDSV